MTGYLRKMGGVCCGGFFVLTAQMFPVHSSIDVLWFLCLTEFDLLSSLVGNSLTSFEA